MKKILFLFGVLAVMALSALGQVTNPPIFTVLIAPSATCAAGLPNQQVYSTGVQYSCQNVTGSTGTWGVVGAGAGGPPTGTAGGDLSGTYPNPGVAQVNGAVVPTSALYVASNSSKQLVAATTPLLPANNLSDVGTLRTAQNNLGVGYVNIGNVVTVACTDSGASCSVGSAPYVITLTAVGTTNGLVISAIPGTYLDLRIKILGLGSTSPSAWLITFNGDSTAGHYEGSNIAVNTSVTGAQAAGIPTACAGIANTAGGCIIDIPFYAQAIAHYGFGIGHDVASFATAGANYTYYDQFAWSNAGAITSITLKPLAGTFTGVASIQATY